MEIKTYNHLKGKLPLSIYNDFNQLNQGWVKGIFIGDANQFDSSKTKHRSKFYSRECSKAKTSPHTSHILLAQSDFLLSAKHFWGLIVQY